MLNVRAIVRASLLTSFASKFSGLLYQLLAVPMVLLTLGGEEFGLFMVLSGFSTWLGLVSSGVAPLLTSMVAKGEPDKDIQDSYIATTVYLLLVFSLLLIFLALFAESISSYLSDINKSDFLLIYMLVVINIIFSIAESVNQGRHKQYINNIIFCVGSLLNLMFLYISISYFGVDGIVSIFVASQLGITCIKFLNWLYISYDLIKFKMSNPFVLETLKRVFSVVGAFFLIQLSVVVFQQALILIVYGYSKELSGMLGLVFRLHAIMGSFLNMVNQPVWPIIVDAIKNLRFDWVRLLYFKLISLYVLFGLLCLGGLVFFGPNLFESWTAGQYHFSGQVCLWVGIQFCLIAITQANNSVLMGMEEFKFLGFVMCFESIVALLLIVGGLEYFGIQLHQIIMISSVVYLLTSFWIVPRKLLNRLAK